MRETYEEIQMLRRARRVLHDPDSIHALSSGQVAAVAFVLNSPEMLKHARMTLVDALHRFSQSEIDAIRFAADELYNPSIN
jgi:hypothetical protein